VRKWLCKRRKRKGKEVLSFSFSGVWINREARNDTSPFPYFRPLESKQPLGQDDGELPVAERKKSSRLAYPNNLGCKRSVLELFFERIGFGSGLTG